MDLQQKIITELHVKPQIDVEAEIRQSVDLMKEYLKAHPFLKTLVLGISGGQDSTLLGKLAQIAAEEMRMETGDANYQFIAVRLPYGKQVDEADAQAVLDWIEPDEVLMVNIKPTVDETVNALRLAGIKLSDFNKGNIKARERMVVQYAIAAEKQGVVLGSDHAAESVTGFYTKYGDGSSDLVPLYRLNKRQGAAMLKELGAPEWTYKKVPTADLEEEKPAQADEEALGVTYEEIDDYLEGKPVPKVAKDRIEELYLKSQHKRHLPITLFDNFWKK